MKKTLITAALLATASAQTANADDVKIGVFLGFTGAIESLVADMGPAAQLAIEEVSKSGALLDLSLIHI